MKRINSSAYELSTGRRFSANRGIVGLSPNPEDEPWQPFEGYDGDIVTEPVDWVDPPDPGWSSVERRELAEFMIALWREWAEQS